MDEYRRITENTQALSVTLELDQAEYLPGENICAKISVANRTGRPLEVFAPFQTKHQTRLSLFGYRGSPDRPAGMEWEPLSRPEPAFGDNTIAAKLENHKRIMLLPAEEIRARSCLGDFEDDPNGVFPFQGGMGLLQPGRHKLCFGYAAPACQEFRVVEPTGITAVASSAWPHYFRGLSKEKQAKTSEECTGVVAAAVKTPEGTVVVYSQARSICGSAERGVENLLRSMCPFRRIEKTEDQVNALRMGPGEGPEMKIEWEGRRGEKVVRRVNPGRNHSAVEGRQNR